MMRRWLLILMACLTLAALVPGNALAQGPPPPHKDPAAVEGGFDVLTLFRYYGSVLRLLSSANYEDAKELLEQLQLANIPEDIRFLIERYGDLLGRLGDTLDAADSSLTRASTLIDLGERSAAVEELQEAGNLLTRAQRLLEELRAATETVGRRFGVFGLSLEDPLREAFDQLQSLLERLAALQEQYAMTLERLETAATAPPVEPTPVAAVEPTPVYATLVEFTAPEQGYPGRSLRIAGRVSSPDGPALTGPVPLNILLDRVILDEFTSQPAFEREIRLSDDTQVGRHVLTVEVLPHGFYQGTRAERPLEVVLARPTLTLDAPGFAFLPGDVRVSGDLASELGPLVNALVTLELTGKRVQVRTDGDGHFTASLGVSLSGAFLGPQALHVMVDPAEPWHLGVSREVSIFIVNGVNLGLLTLAFVYVGTVLAMIWRRRRARRRAPAILEAEAAGRAMGSKVSPTAVAPLPAAPADFGAGELGGLRRRVVVAYFTAARFLEASRAVSMHPYFTLRDFLGALGLHMGSSFAELTLLAERALYAPSGPGEAEVQRAEELVHRVSREGV